MQRLVLAMFCTYQFQGENQGVCDSTFNISSDFNPIQANCIDSTAEAEVVFAGEVKKMQAEKMKPQEQVTLEPYERDHAVVVGVYRPPPKQKA